MPYYRHLQCGKTFFRDEFSNEDIEISDDQLDFYCPICKKRMGIIDCWFEFCDVEKVALPEDKMQQEEQERTYNEGISGVCRNE